MIAILIKENGENESYENVLEFSESKIVCSAGKGKVTVFAGNGDYFKLSEGE